MDTPTRPILSKDAELGLDLMSSQDPLRIVKKKKSSLETRVKMIDKFPIPEVVSSALRRVATQ